MILETYRECLRDVLDLPGLRDVLTRLHRAVALIKVETATASPFAASLLFAYIANFIYDGDAPNAERRAAALSLDRDLLRELLGQEELRDLIDRARSSRSRPTCSAARSTRAATRTSCTTCCGASAT